jgi:putative oxidoreductase
VLIMLGLFTRAASLLLAGFCLLTAVIFHVKFGDKNQLLHFEKNLAVSGGFLVLSIVGPGGLSLARVLGHAQRSCGWWR